MMQTQHKFEERQEVSLKLGQYEDIFSDFDIRHYSKRALSVDFLDEIKRATLDKDEGGIELVLHVPENGRHESHEATIKERLTMHFRKHFHILQKDKLRIMRLGTGMVVFGIIFMILATFIVFEDPAQNLLLSFLVVFLEPAAWFLLWEGMDQIIFNSKSVNSELDFYRKMASSEGHIHFKSY